MLLRHNFKEKYLAKWGQTKWLVLSSSFLLLPAAYAYNKKLYFHSGLLIATSLISANYWRKATYSWRRIIDLIFAKISFSIFFIHGIMYIRYIPHLIFTYPITFFIFSSYDLSNNLFEFRSNRWYKYHFTFHTLMTIQIFFILNNLAEKFQ
jgi:hypothetical protein